MQQPSKSHISFLTLYPLKANYEEPLKVCSELSGFCHVLGLLIEQNDSVCIRGWCLAMQLPFEKLGNYSNGRQTKS